MLRITGTTVGVSLTLKSSTGLAKTDMRFGEIHTINASVLMSIFFGFFFKELLIQKLHNRFVH